MEAVVCFLVRKSTKFANAKSKNSLYLYALASNRPKLPLIEVELRVGLDRNRSGSWDDDLLCVFCAPVCLLCCAFSFSFAVFFSSNVAWLNSRRRRARSAAAAGGTLGLPLIMAI